ncbi:MAG: hypothetical protein HY653_08800 [Acidobacteria bacterium]|nr:hypothetical protein [Acidobacteriota bacterium]
MKMLRRVSISLVMILLSALLLHGQDLSQYRNFSFGMSLAEVSKQVDLKPLLTKLIHERPAVIQELTWWPRDSSVSSLQAEPIWQVLFTFYNGELYRILVTYERRATEGLTTEDMVEAISAKYGAATRPDVEISFPTNELYNSTEKVIARWEDSQYSFNLFRSTVLNTFGLIMFSKRLDAEVRTAATASLELEGQEDRQREIDRQQKKADDLEVARQKNRESFRP